MYQFFHNFVKGVFNWRKPIFDMRSSFCDNFVSFVLILTIWNVFENVGFTLCIFLTLEFNSRSYHKKKIACQNQFSILKITPDPWQNHEKIGTWISWFSWISYDFHDESGKYYFGPIFASFEYFLLKIVLKFPHDFSPSKNAKSGEISGTPQTPFQ